MTSEQRLRIVFEAAVILSLGVVIGLSINHRLVFSAFSGRVVTPVVHKPTAQVGVAYPRPIGLDEVLAARDVGAILVDARIPEVYREGHIAGAVPLPLADVDAYLDDFLARFAPDQQLILYCSGYGCPDSFDLGLRLIDEGYLDVWSYEGGMPEWRAAGLPVERVPR
ncbi:rhodanese-like domain-containing protein [Geoalkalibacter halelectricus]|uniref:Rhodanese-like domain-containing protein n=1 Tax=Geoalkalibacter halelectricus TaxID=2847045 RepID=A0ABY5ZP89_9BACT|nr:rhodanese-like domain-containing protein [Geoalkalibacter halelectricus]MDO3377352.1 rhodanese-like domain-containing protein [Geoalkalibacter halelectricus]UWZ80883.1 rhodanese-like domain-containing protein [Geoalkalibacter halelectricus]